MGFTGDVDCFQILSFLWYHINICGTFIPRFFFPKIISPTRFFEGERSISGFLLGSVIDLRWNRWNGGNEVSSHHVKVYELPGTGMLK